MIVICNNDYPFMCCKKGTTYEEGEVLARLFYEHDKANIERWENYKKAYPNSVDRPPGQFYYHVHSLREI